MSDFDDYRSTLGVSDRALGLALEGAIARALPQAVGKVWHGHPVWFIDGNPVVGYNMKTSGMRVLFWSGKSFVTPGLTAIGSFKAAEFAPESVEGLNAVPFEAWLGEAATIQWDYKNLPKNKGLAKLTEF